MFALARTFALVGVDAEPVYVEVDIGAGLPSFTIVGLPDAAGWFLGVQWHPEDTVATDEVQLALFRALVEAGRPGLSPARRA